MDNASSQELLQFLRSHDVAALASIKENKAYASTIYYFVEDDLRFYFLTRNGTLKFTNLRENGGVGLVITDQQTLQTVQVQGIAKEVDYSKEYQTTVKKFTDQLAKSGKEWEKIPINHITSGYYAFVQITPTWIRWTDFINWAHKVKFEQKFA